MIMDKSDVKVHESHSDTSSVITMKEYAPSEYPSSEPPPAYMKPRSNALRIAKLAAFTVIVSSIILGGFILAASWIQVNTARNLDLTLNQELLDDLHPSYEQLVANEVVPEQQHNSLSQSQQQRGDLSAENQTEDKSSEKTTDQDNEEGLIPPPPPPSFGEKTNEDNKKVLDLDEIANILMQKNMKGNVNCIVEKRRNEELVDHAPVSLNLPSPHSPFGLNITTPPRLQHLTGEQIIVVCKGDENEDKDSESEEGGNDADNKVDDMQPIVFPLPNQLLSQVQQIPQIIPLNSILQHVQLQQVPVRPMPVQQIPMRQIPLQQIPIQQIPVQQIQMQQQPQVHVQHVPVPIQVQQIPLQPMPTIHQLRPQPQLLQPRPQQLVFHQNMMVEQPQPQVQQIQLLPQPQPQPQQRPIFLPQRIFFPPPQIQQNVAVPQPEIIPLKEIPMNQNRIPVNHVLHHRVPINPMAVNDIPISRMQITHLPMRGEPQIKEEPVPVHHLMPPQAQQIHAENFNEQPMRFFPAAHQQQPRPMPVEVRDPGVLRVPGPMAQEPREPFSVPTPVNQVFPHSLIENVEERNFRPLTVDVRPRGQRREPLVNNLLPELPKIFPFNMERRPVDSGRKIRFPDMVESEDVKENNMPIITEITKIIPIRLEKLEKDESEVNDGPILPLGPNTQPKNLEAPEIKIEKMPPRPFPIPINAILDMIFRGIRPLMNNRAHSFPIPIDIKIERIENKPLEMMTPPFFKKLEILKKEVEDSLEDDQSEEKTEGDDSTENDKDSVEVNEDNENGHPMPMAGDAQVFKLEDDKQQQPQQQQQQQEQSESDEQSSFEDQAFLPNGQGRGARVFPIPEAVKEAEIFSVFDAKAEKAGEGEISVGSAMTVADADKEPEQSDNRQGRIMGFPTPLINLFPISQNKEIKEDKPMAPMADSLKLLPVPESTVKTEEAKPAVADADESRPHFVQPRSV